MMKLDTGFVIIIRFGDTHWVPRLLVLGCSMNFASKRHTWRVGHYHYVLPFSSSYSYFAKAFMLTHLMAVIFIQIPFLFTDIHYHLIDFNHLFNWSNFSGSLFSTFIFAEPKDLLFLTPLIKNLSAFSFSFALNDIPNELFH